MTTDTAKNLRTKAQKAVETRFERIPAFEWFEDPTRISALANAALNAVGFDALLNERDRLRQALNEYANPVNWEMDAENVWRVWREPGSSTPEAYDGFHLARAALKEQAA